MEPLKCIHCGYCCKEAPCPFGTAKDPQHRDYQCIELVQKGSKYYCGKYEEIIKVPGADVCPAFGAGCCSPLNSSYWNIIRGSSSSSNKSN